MVDNVDNEVVAVLRYAQRRLDHRLTRVFDAGTRHILQQAQVHIHEALLLLWDEFDDESGGCAGLLPELGIKPPAKQRRNRIARDPVRSFELRLAYSQDDAPGNG
jgi:hypothetical protein